MADNNWGEEEEVAAASGATAAIGAVVVVVGGACCVVVNSVPSEINVGNDDGVLLLLELLADCEWMMMWPFGGGNVAVVVWGWGLLLLLWMMLPDGRRESNSTIR